MGGRIFLDIAYRSFIRAVKANRHDSDDMAVVRVNQDEDMNASVLQFRYVLSRKLDLYMSNGLGVYWRQKAKGHVELAEVWKVELGKGTKALGKCGKRIGY
jgi:hypothetical protein